MSGRIFRSGAALPILFMIAGGLASTSMGTDANWDLRETGWRVLGVPYGGPIDGRDLDGEAFTPETDIWLKVGDKVNLTYYHGFDPDKIGVVAFFS